MDGVFFKLSLDGPSTVGTGGSESVHSLGNALFEVPVSYRLKQPQQLLLAFPCHQRRSRNVCVLSKYRQ
jgi:hypothetical protein